MTAELLYRAESYYSVNFRYFEALSVAAIWYLVIYTFLVAVQSAVEARFGERQILGARPSFAQRLFGVNRGAGGAVEAEADAVLPASR